MKRRTVAVAATALMIAAGFGVATARASAWGPRLGAATAAAAYDQSAAVAGQSPRARTVQILRAGSWIGVSIRDVEAADAKAATGAATGVIVEDVAADSPAAQAGVRKGDVIVEFDGERVRSARQLTRLVQETPSGRTVQAALLRDGQRTTVSVTPREGERFNFDTLEDAQEMARNFRLRVMPRAPSAPTPPSPPNPPSLLEELAGRSNRLGITISDLSPQLAEYFGTKRGVLVTSVADGSVAQKTGVKAGDVITAVNGSSVERPADVRRRLESLEDGDELILDVTRDRKPVTLKGRVERPERRRGVTTTIL